MLKKIKIDKKKLKQPDEFVSTTSKLVDSLVVNWKRTVLILVIIFGSLGSFTGIKFYTDYVDRKILEDISQAVNSNQSGNGLAPDSIVLLQKAAQRGGKKTSGLISRIYLGNNFYKVAMYDRALEEYNYVLLRATDKVDPLVRELALLSAGYSYEQMKDYSEALEMFEEIADSADSIFADEALISAARCYEQLGQIDNASKSYMRLVAEHPDSAYIPEATTRMEAIGTKIPSKTQ